MENGWHPEQSHPELQHHGDKTTAIPHSPSTSNAWQWPHPRPRGNLENHSNRRGFRVSTSLPPALTSPKTKPARFHPVCTEPRSGEPRCHPSVPCAACTPHTQMCFSPYLDAPTAHTGSHHVRVSRTGRSVPVSQRAPPRAVTKAMPAQEVVCGGLQEVGNGTVRGEGADVLTQQPSSPRLQNALSQLWGCSHPPRSHGTARVPTPPALSPQRGCCCISPPDAPFWLCRIFCHHCLTPRLNSNKSKRGPKVCIELGCAWARNIQRLRKALQLVWTDQNTLHQDRNPTQTLLERIWSKLRTLASIYARENIFSSSSDPPTFQKGDLQDGANSLPSESAGGTVVTHRHQS